MKSVFLSTLFLLSTNSYSINFRSGDEFTVNNYIGEVTTFCSISGLLEKVQHQCNLKSLAPLSADYLVDETLDADDLIITYLNEKNEEKKIKVSYNSMANRSLIRINLWEHYTGIDPILHLGQNTIHIKARKRGLPVREETINVNVKLGGDKYCESRTYFLSEMNDCFDSKYACAYYFSDEKKCK